MPFDPNFGSAVEAAAAIRAGEISSVELLAHTLGRIDACQPKLNAYVYQLREEARAAAREADEALAAGAAVGPLHGVPVNVKESFGVEGQPCTWGIPQFKDVKAPAHSVAVRRLLDAGAILVGATNVPMSLADYQTFNEIYGRSNNPWDVSRTPGGSSGGSAASLAAGMAFLSVGSDMGGSIRTPASFCGIYGHKPTLDIVSLAGQLPGGVRNHPGFSTHLACGGPMARSAADLAAALEILAGPEAPESKAFRWTLPAARHRTLREYRIGFVLEDPSAPISTETKSVIEAAVRACEKAGAVVEEGWPAGFRLSEVLECYLFLLGAFDFSVSPPPRQERMRPVFAGRTDPYARGALSDFVSWQRNNLQRLAYRAMWEKFFGTVDVFLLPTILTTAIPHDPAPLEQRQIPLPEGGSLPFWHTVDYIAPATLTGCPATTAPVGLSRSGLPVGLQIMGPYLEDGTPIEFARLLAEVIGGFVAPAGY